MTLTFCPEWLSNTTWQTETMRVLGAHKEHVGGVGLEVLYNIFLLLDAVGGHHPTLERMAIEMM